MRYSQALKDFVKQERLRGLQPIQTLKLALEDSGETDLLQETERVQEQLGLLDSQKISTLILIAEGELNEGKNKSSEA